MQIKKLHMRKSMIILGVAGVLLAGCGNKAPQTAVITVSSNPTTGYSWQVTQTEELFDITSEFTQGTPAGTAEESPQGDPESTAVTDSTENPAADVALVGAGGTETITLTPKAKGKTEVTLAYAREWEDTAPETEITYTFEVTRSMQIKQLTATGSVAGDGDTIPDLPEIVIK